MVGIFYPVTIISPLRITDMVMRKKINLILRKVCSRLRKLLKRITSGNDDDIFNNPYLIF